MLVTSYEPASWSVADQGEDSAADLEETDSARLELPAVADRCMPNLVAASVLAGYFHRTGSMGTRTS